MKLSSIQIRSKQISAMHFGDTHEIYFLYTILHNNLLKK